MPHLNLARAHLSAGGIRTGEGRDTHAAKPANNSAIANLYDLIRPPSADHQPASNRCPEAQ